MKFDELSNKVLGCAIEVHRELGPGLLESTYEQCLAHELSQLNISFKLQVELPVEYKQIRLDCGYRIDLLVDNRIIVELKSVDQLLKIHEAQVLTYMKLAGVRVGLLINFNVDALRNGIKKICSLNLRVLRALRGEQYPGDMDRMFHTKLRRTWWRTNLY